MKKRIKKGFTLVELLVVIAILGILATVSVVGYSSFTEKAKESVAQQELTQIHNYLFAADVEDETFSFVTDGISFADADVDTLEEATKVVRDALADTDAADLATAVSVSKINNKVATELSYTKDGVTVTLSL